MHVIIPVMIRLGICIENSGKRDDAAARSILLLQINRTTMITNGLLSAPKLDRSAESF